MAVYHYESLERFQPESFLLYMGCGDIVICIISMVISFIGGARSKFLGGPISGGRRGAAGAEFKRRSARIEVPKGVVKRGCPLPTGGAPSTEKN